MTTTGKLKAMDGDGRLNRQAAHEAATMLYGDYRRTHFEELVAKAESLSSSAEEFSNALDSLSEKLEEMKENES